MITEGIYTVGYYGGYEVIICVLEDDIILKYLCTRDDKEEINWMGWFVDNNSSDSLIVNTMINIYLNNKSALDNC